MASQIKVISNEIVLPLFVEEVVDDDKLDVDARVGTAVICPPLRPPGEAKEAEVPVGLGEVVSTGAEDVTLSAPVSPVREGRGAQPIAEASCAYCYTNISILIEKYERPGRERMSQSA